MPWLWFAGPLTFIFVAVVFSLWPSAEERRLRRELLRWLRTMLGPRPGEGDALASRLVRALPLPLNALLTEEGEATRVADIVLVPKFAYLAVRAADATTSTNRYTVLCRLQKPAPRIRCKPLAIVDGRPTENDGIPFKDAEFMDHYVVEGPDPRGVKRWLRRDIREALMQFPDLWLRTEGKVMALSFQGYADAEMLDELIEVADVIFAEYGAGGGEPLFVEQEGSYRDKPARRQRGAHDEVDDEDSAEDPDERLASLQDRVTAGVIDLSLYFVGVVATMAVMGEFAWFHPDWMFNSPDLVVTEPWQGGWTTKGFGALVIVESYLLGLLALQAHLTVRRGQTLGKLFVGLRVEHDDGTPRSFVGTVFLRKWVFAAVPLAVAAVTARPFSSRAFFNQIPTKLTVGVAVATGVALAASWMLNKQHIGLHDRLAKTAVLDCEPYRLPSVQLDVSGRDPVVQRRLMRGAAFFVAFLLVNVITYKVTDAWFLEVHQWK